MIKREQVIVAGLFFSLLGFSGCRTENESASTTSTNNQTETEITEETNADSRKLSENHVTFHIADQTFDVQLYDNPTANDLLTKLPLEVTADDYVGYDEKVLRLSESLSMENASEGDDPLVPEVGYYQPSQWIALYYGPIGYWSGKVPLGKIDASVDELRSIPNHSSVKIEVANP